MKNILLFVFMILGIVMSNNSNANSNAYKFNFRSIDGKEIKLIDFKGKPIFIINTASLCGFTNQYNDIQKIYDKYKKNDLIVLAIPSNDFGNKNYQLMKRLKNFVLSTLI